MDKMQATNSTNYITSDKELPKEDNLYPKTFLSIDLLKKIQEQKDKIAAETKK